MFGSLGFTELILILMIVLIIFGAGKLPQLGEGFGKAIKGFKKSVHEAEAMDSELQGQPSAGSGVEPAGVTPQIPQQPTTAAFSIPPEGKDKTAPVPPADAVSTVKA